MRLGTSPIGFASKLARKHSGTRLLRDRLGTRRIATGQITKSIAEGPNEPPLLPHTIPQHFASIVSQYGDHPAVICRSPTATRHSLPPDVLLPGPIPTSVETVYTYEKLDRVSNKLAHGLRSLGVRKGDRIAVSLGNGAEFAALTYAVFKLGAILVPLNPGFNATQVTAALNHLGVRLLFIGAVTDLAYKPCRGRSNLSLLQTLVPNLDSSSTTGRVESPSVPTLERIVLVDNSLSHPLLSEAFAVGHLRSLVPFASLIEGAPGENVVPDEPLAPHDTINIQFTSGTTAQPKAAKLTHSSILNNGHLIGQRMRLTPADRIVCPPPLFHCFGSVLGYMATATSGAALLLPSPAFDPLASLRMVADHRATGLYGVATMFVAMLETLRRGSEDVGISAEALAGLPSHLRTGIAAGSSVPEPLMQRIYDAFGMEELVICYGMTETSPVSCMTSPDDSLAHRTTSVGRAMPHTRVKVVDPSDRRRVLPVGERGELAAAGYLVMQGYWGDEKATAEVRRLERDEEDGREEVWMYSGDEATMDSDGYVAITGRIKDLIIRGGENIHPLEIEECLFQFPLVAEASVVGVRCERYGEGVGAFVIARPGVRVVHEGEVGEVGENVLTAEVVRQWVRERLSSHLVPKHVFFVDEYPKTASGKIQKFKLREIANQMVEEGRTR